MTDQAVDVLARTLWGEARGCGAAGMKRVANVIMNRAAHPRWWGRGVVGVCLAPWQFSSWNANDPNRAKLLAVTAADPAFAVALGIAADAVAGRLPDTTGGADSYYALSMPRPPSWAAKGTHTLSDGWHWFGRLELAAPGGAPARAVAVAEARVAAVDSADALNARELARVRF